MVANFIVAYCGFIFTQGEEEVIDEVIAKNVWDNFQAIQESAGGMDGWQPAELAMVSRSVSKWIVVLFKLVEAGPPQ